MNNLHRELAPISDAAWAEIEEEASRTLKRHLAARRVVDVQGPKGVELSAVGTGHLQQIQAPGEGIQAAQRAAKALVELRVPFELSRQAIDDVERGATDSDWSPVKEAARKIAFAEDRSVFNGYAAAGIQGIREGSSNPPIALPSNVKGYSGAVAQAVSQLRLAGVNGPYALVLGADGVHGRQRGKRRGLSGFSPHRTGGGRRDHLGACHRGRVRDDHPRRGFRAGYRSGHLDRLPVPFQHSRRTVFPGDLHFSVADDRGCGRA